MNTKVLNLKLARSLIKERKKDSHKGTFGHVLIIGGSKNMFGAPVLSAMGAIRSGAGLVTVAVPECIYENVARRLRPEAMIFPVKCTRDGYISANSYLDIKKYILKRRVSSIVLGPGMGRTKDTKAIVKKLLKTAGIPVVLDADGINAAGSKNNSLSVRLFKEINSEVILTPHQGEMSSLINLKAGIGKSKRVQTAKEFAKLNKLVCVLKGHESIISDGKCVYKNTTGNPGLATGGSGDVLSGVIAGLIKQVKSPYLLNSALFGVYVHGLSGDITSGITSQVSMTASDIAENLKLAFKKIGIK